MFRRICYIYIRLPNIAFVIKSNADSRTGNLHVYFQKTNPLPSRLFWRLINLLINHCFFSYTIYCRRYYVRTTCDAVVTFRTFYFIGIYKSFAIYMYTLSGVTSGYSKDVRHWVFFFKHRWNFKISSAKVNTLSSQIGIRRIRRRSSCCTSRTTRLLHEFHCVRTKFLSYLHPELLSKTDRQMRVVLSSAIDREIYWRSRDDGIFRFCLIFTHQLHVINRLWTKIAWRKNRLLLNVRNHNNVCINTRFIVFIFVCKQP